MFPFNSIIKQKSLRPKSLTSNFFCLIFKVVCLLFPTHASRPPNSFFSEKQLAIFWASFQALLRLCLVSYQAFLPTALFRLCLVSYQALAYSLAQARPGVEPKHFCLQPCSGSRIQVPSWIAFFFSFQLLFPSSCSSSTGSSSSSSSPPSWSAQPCSGSIGFACSASTGCG